MQHSPHFSFNFSLEEQVLSRFEEENGGQIVVATVCLLETSRHGLLETELLQMLAEESTLTPPPYVEGESDQITVTKVEETQAGLYSVQSPSPPPSISPTRLDIWNRCVCRLNFKTLPQFMTKLYCIFYPISDLDITHKIFIHFHNRRQNTTYFKPEWHNN